MWLPLKTPRITIKSGLSTASSDTWQKIDLAKDFVPWGKTIGMIKTTTGTVSTLLNSKWLTTRTSDKSKMNQETKWHKTSASANVLQLKIPSEGKCIDMKAKKKLRPSVSWNIKSKKNDLVAVSTNACRTIKQSILNDSWTCKRKSKKWKANSMLRENET